MSSLLWDAFIGDQGPQRKAIESISSINMVCNILNFLDASSMTLFEGPPIDQTERDRFYLENFESIVSCVMAPNESVRRLAVGVAKQLLASDQVLLSLRASNGLDAADFKTNFWRLRYAVAVTTR